VHSSSYGFISDFWIADSAAGFSYSFGGSCLILFIINLIPGLHLRASEEDEIMGMDDAEVGEFAYDYVEVSRDVVHGIEEEADNADTPDGSSSGLREKNHFRRDGRA
jgi:Amt family ammonium transporter